jgi:heptosyltransferase-3
MSNKPNGHLGCPATIDARMPGRGSRRARLLDRYLGIPLVFLAGQFRRKRSMPLHPRKIGLLNTAAVGDTVLMSGPLADLREAYPSTEIVLLTGPNNYEAGCLLKGADLVVKVDVWNPLAAIRAVREQHFDLLLDFGPWCRLNAVIAICSGAEFIGGFRTSAQGRHFGYDLIVDHSENAHELENHRGLIRALGIRPQHAPSLQCEPSVHPASLDRSKRFVVFHLWPGGSSAKFREWPVGRWVALAEDFATDQYDVVFTGAEHQRTLNDSIIAEVKDTLRPRMRNVAGSSLRETLQLLMVAKLVVSVDTGVMHMAAASGVPLVALHGPSSPHRWGPVSENALVVEPSVSGCGFLNLGFEKVRGGNVCMNAISYGSVKTACNTALGKGIAGRRLWAPIYASSKRASAQVVPVRVEQRL